MNKRSILTINILMALIFIPFLRTSTLLANQCTKNVAVFARGSGQPLQMTQTTEAGRFFDQLKKRLPTNSTLEEYNLGTGTPDKSRYPAVSVDPWSHSDTLFGAWASSGQLYEYGKSVDQGVNELVSYLNDKHTQCSDSRYILSGYSQGAQVIGQALPLIPKEVRDHIVFVALFGDPKLNLPEGKGFNPPACHNEAFSSYRRLVPDCDTDSGSLGIREPYLPEDMANKTGLWCNDDDLVCGSSILPWINDGHGKYATENGPIDDAAQEIALRLDPPEKSKGLASFFSNTFFQAPDVMLVIENSTNVSPAYYANFVKPLASLIVNSTIASGGRVGLETFTGCNPWSTHKSDYTYPTAYAKTVLDKINNLRLYRPYCNPAIEFADKIQHAKSTAWQQNAPHIIISLTVSAPILSVTPASIRLVKNDEQLYVIAPPEIASAYANKTISGIKIAPVNSDTLNQTALQSTPTLDTRLDGPNLKAKPGTMIRFRANSTVVTNDSIASYEWDYNSDGVFEVTTQQPEMTHTYTDPFDGQLVLRVSTIRGLQDTTTQKVTIAHSQTKLVAKAPHNLTATRTSTTTAHIEWRAADQLADSWLIYINDLPLGRVVGNQTFVNLGDLSTDPTIISVRAVTKEWEYGDPSTVTLESTPSFSTLHNMPPIVANILSPLKNELGHIGKVLGASSIGLRYAPNDNPSQPYQSSEVYHDNAASKTWSNFNFAFVLIIPLITTVFLLMRKRIIRSRLI